MDINQYEMKFFYEELKKLKMTPAHKSTFFDGKLLDPEIEEDIIEQIQEFDQKIRGVKMVNVYEYIGSPAFDSNPDDKNIEQETLRLTQLLNDHNIFPDSLYEVSPQKYYNFLIHTVFEQKVEDGQNSEIKYDFSYEDFFPDKIRDINRYSIEFFETLFDEDKEFCTMLVFHEVISRNGSVINEKFVKYLLINWMETYRDMVLRNLTLTSVYIEDYVAVQEFTIDYYGYDGFSGKLKSERGKGELHYVFRYGFWYINKIQFPGIEV